MDSSSSPCPHPVWPSQTPPLHASRLSNSSSYPHPVQPSQGLVPSLNGLIGGPMVPGRPLRKLTPWSGSYLDFHGSCGLFWTCSHNQKAPGTFKNQINPSETQIRSIQSIWSHSLTTSCWSQLSLSPRKQDLFPKYLVHNSKGPRDTYHVVLTLYACPIWKMAEGS